MKPHVKAIIAAAAQLAAVSPESLVERRFRGPSAWRRRAMFIARRCWSHIGYPQLALHFRRDHTTLVYAVQQTEAAIARGDNAEISAIGELCEALGLEGVPEGRTMGHRNLLWEIAQTERRLEQLRQELRDLEADHAQAA